jgi:hypothetical protein
MHDFDGDTATSAAIHSGVYLSQRRHTEWCPCEIREELVGGLADFKLEKVFNYRRHELQTEVRIVRTIFKFGRETLILERPHAAGKLKRAFVDDASNSRGCPPVWFVREWLAMHMDSLQRQELHRRDMLAKLDIDSACTWMSLRGRLVMQRTVLLQDH